MRSAVGEEFPHPRVVSPCSGTDALTRARLTVLRTALGLAPDGRFALRQAPAVAAARHVPTATVVNLVNKMTHHSFLGVVGTDHLNVLQLNLALDQLPAQ